MAVNLLLTYNKKIDEAYTKQSLVKPHFTQQVSFSGVRTVQILTPQTVPVGDYKREGENRYGIPKEMQDTIQELQLTQDKGFSLTIDKGNNADQGGLKAAGRMMALQVREQCVPEMDRYMLNKVAHQAGQIIGEGTKISSKNIVERIAKGTAALDNAEVPDEGRTLFISADKYMILRLSDQFIALEKLGVRAISRGEVGEFDGMKVIKIPKARWPKGANFIIAHKAAATACQKIAETNLHESPRGISGNVLEGRYYYDIFVLMNKANGIYVDVDTSEATVTADPSIAASGGQITSEDTVYHTTDGTDPRYSKTAVLGKTPAVTEAGTIVKAYAISATAGAYPSKVITQELT